MLKELWRKWKHERRMKAHFKRLTAYDKLVEERLKARGPIFYADFSSNKSSSDVEISANSLTDTSGIPELEIIEEKK